MRRLMVMMTMGIMLSTATAFAAETLKAETKPEKSEALKVCGQRVVVFEQTINGLAQGIQREMEVAGLRLKANLPPASGDTQK